jgi:hypothetical protein
LKKSHAGVFWHGWRELLSVPHGPVPFRQHNQPDLSLKPVRLVGTSPLPALNTLKR